MFFFGPFSVILSLAILHYQKGAWSQSPPALVGGAKRNQEEYIDRFYNSQQFSNILYCYCEIFYNYRFLAISLAIAFNDYVSKEMPRVFL
jgi:hypothetical protein